MRIALSDRHGLLLASLTFAGRLLNSMDFVEGIVNLRGQIVPIVDLCKRFLVVERDAGIEVDRRIIVVNMAEQNIGVLVDGVSEILRVSDESIEATPPMVASGMSAEFIRGVAKVKDRLIIVLDLDRIFSTEEREMLIQPAV